MRAIYKLVNDINKKCYIGKTEDVASRLRYHIKSLRAGTNKNKHLQNAYNKYGRGNFHIEIVEELSETDDIDERERYYIALYKTYDPQYGYNRTYGGDGGNSYVDCMTEEEREAHWKKHIELRMGENNPNYHKKLYNNGITQKYLTEDEIEEYESQGWVKGTTKLFKEQCSERSKGKNNPFYGKHHSKELQEQINESRRKTMEKKGKTYIYHKGDQQTVITQDEIEKYENEGWIHGMSDKAKDKLSKSRLANPTPHPWSEEQRKKQLTHYVYEGRDFYGRPELKNYLRENGYPLIGMKEINNITVKLKSKNYPELVGKIIIIKKEDK